MPPEAPLGRPVPDDGHVVADEASSALLRKDGLAAATTLAEIGEGEPEPPSFSSGDRLFTSEGNAEDLEDVSLAAMVGARPEDRSGTSPAALTGLAATAVEGNLDVWKRDRGAGDVHLGRGDRDLLSITNAGGSDQVSADSVAVPTAEEDPVGIAASTVLSGNGEPAVPVDPVGGGARGGEGREVVAGEARDPSGGDSIDRVPGVPIPTRLPGSSRPNLKLSRDREAAGGAPLAGSRGPDRGLPGGGRPTEGVAPVLIGIVRGVAKEVHADSTRNAVTRGDPVGGGIAIEGPVEEHHVLTEREEPSKVKLASGRGKSRVRDIGEDKGPRKGNGRAPMAEVLRARFPAAAEGAGRVGRHCVDPAAVMELFRGRRSSEGCVVEGSARRVTKRPPGDGPWRRRLSTAGKTVAAPGNSPVALGWCNPDPGHVR